MPPVVSAGQIRKRVAIQTAVTTRDDIGGWAEAWSTTLTRWARVEPLQGKELLAAQQLEARVTHRVTLRYVAGLAPTQRLLLGTRVLAILRVLDLEEYHVTHQLWCMEVV